MRTIAAVDQELIVARQTFIDKVEAGHDVEAAVAYLVLDQLLEERLHLPIQRSARIASPSTQK